MYVSRGFRLYFSKKVFFCLKIFFTFTNSADSDEMQHYAAFHLGLHCLQKYLFSGFLNTKDPESKLLAIATGLFKQITLTGKELCKVDREIVLPSSGCM